MRSRDAVGRRIVSVKQHRYNARQAGRSMVTNVTALVLDNGRELRFFVQETDFGEYAVDVVVSDKPKSKGESA